MATKGIPSVPDVPFKFEGSDIYRILEPLKRIIDIRQGKFDPLDRWVTQQDLIDAGLQTESAVMSPVPIIPPTSVFELELTGNITGGPTVIGDGTPLIQMDTTITLPIAYPWTFGDTVTFQDTATFEGIATFEVGSFFEGDITMDSASPIFKLIGDATNDKTIYFTHGTGAIPGDVDAQFFHDFSNDSFRMLRLSNDGQYSTSEVRMYGENTGGALEWRTGGVTGNSSDVTLLLEGTAATALATFTLDVDIGGDLEVGGDLTVLSDTSPLIKLESTSDVTTKLIEFHDDTGLEARIHQSSSSRFMHMAHMAANQITTAAQVIVDGASGEVRIEAGGSNGVPSQAGVVFSGLAETTGQAAFASDVIVGDLATNLGVLTAHAGADGATGRMYFTNTGDLVVGNINSPDMIQLVDFGATDVDNATAYMEFSWATAFGDSLNRMGYVGFSGGLSSDLTIQTDDSNGSIIFRTGGGTLALTVNENQDGIFVGNISSLGIDDNATGERFQLADTLADWGTGGATFGHVHSVDDQYIVYSGGNSTSSGGNMWAHGGTHASRAGDLDLRSSGNAFLQWDESVGELELLTGIGTKTIALTIDASQNATFAGNVLVESATPILTIDSTSASGDTRLRFRQATTQKAFIEFQDTGDIFRIDSDNDILFASGNSTALTLDGSTQEATFSADVAVEGYFLTNTATDAELNAIANAINTAAGKVQGAMVYNTDQDVPVWAVGNADGDVWVDGAGTTINTPV